MESIGNVHFSEPDCSAPDHMHGLPVSASKSNAPLGRNPKAPETLKPKALNPRACDAASTLYNPKPVDLSPL